MSSRALAGLFSCVFFFYFLFFILYYFFFLSSFLYTRYATFRIARLRNRRLVSPRPTNSTAASFRPARSRPRQKRYDLCVGTVPAKFWFRHRNDATRGSCSGPSPDAFPHRSRVVEVLYYVNIVRIRISLRRKISNTRRKSSSLF